MWHWLLLSLRSQPGLAGSLAFWLAASCTAPVVDLRGFACDPQGRCARGFHCDRDSNTCVAGIDSTSGDAGRGDLDFGSGDSTAGDHDSHWGDQQSGDGTIAGDPAPMGDATSPGDESPSCSSLIPPDNPATTCSSSAGERAQATFTNNCAEGAIEIFWVRQDCGETSYRSILPGGSWSVISFVGHPWRARDVATGRLLKEFPRVVSGGAAYTVP